MPVGFEHIVYMITMDFEEFLWAKGINDAVHIAMLNYFKEYIWVGRMPAVVDVFLKTNNYKMVHSEQRDN